MKRIFFIGLLIFIFMVVAGIVIITNTRKLNHYYDKTVEIRQEDSLNLKITNVWLNRGYLFLNDSLYIWGSKIDEPNLQLIDIYELGLPFYLKKAANNDTVWVINFKKTYFFVFRKDKGSNEY
jgi:hypothetical protein